MTPTITEPLPVKNIIIATTTSSVPESNASTPSASQPIAPIHPPALGRAEIDSMIWDWWKKDSLTPDEISDRLCDMGYSYGERSVEIRLISQGADLEPPAEENHDE